MYGCGYVFNPNVNAFQSNCSEGLHLVLFIIIINPRRACAARVTVLGLSFCLSVRTRYSGSTRD